MSSVIAFVPRSDLSAKENVANFVIACRATLTALGADLAFDSDVWDLTAHLKSKARRGVKRIYFSKFGSTRGNAEFPLEREFLDFAKSYIRFTYAVRPTASLSSRLLALQAVEAALFDAQGKADPTRLNVQALNRAAQFVDDRFEPSTRYQVGRELAALVEFMRRKRMLVVPVTWKNPLPRPAHTTRIGPGFEERRDRKLPSVHSLEAIAAIFRKATEASDVLVSSTCAVLCSAPDRISEVLLLPEVCEVTQTNSSTGQPMYGLRWFPAKGGPPQVKWAATVMADVLKEAVSKIRAQTNRARELARWYECNPGRLYLPEHLEHLRDAAALTMAKVHQIVFETDKPNGLLGGTWCRQHKLKMQKIEGRVYLSFNALEAFLLSLLPDGFPRADTTTGMKYSEMLFVVQRNALNVRKGTYRSVIQTVDSQNIMRRLSGDTVLNIFGRFGYFNADGTPISIRTHQFRHYLNTLAQAGGMGQVDIAFWSGRKSVMQNDAYDHVSGNDLLALAEAATGTSDSRTTAVAMRTFSLISRADWKKLGVEAGHTTEFGYCLHDFSMLPCQLHLDCINCDEQVCVKGDQVREANIRRQLSETRSLLEAAEAAYGDGAAGSNRWVEHQRTTLARLELLCSLLDSPDVQVGAAIKLSGINPPSKLQQSADRIRITRSQALS